MDSLTQFEFEETRVRTLTKEDGSVWFVAKDVCDILDIQNAPQAAQKLDEDDIYQAYITDSVGRKQLTTCISEPGLYVLVLRSGQPEANEFRRWVTKEVIPSIRKTGSYSAKPATVFDMLRSQIDALESMDKKVRVQEGKIAALEMDLYKRDGYSCVAGYLKRLGRNCDAKTAAMYGRKLSALCRKINREISSVDHPVFGRVNAYPEEILDEYFGVVKVPLNPRILPGGFLEQTELN